MKGIEDDLYPLGYWNYQSLLPIISNMLLLFLLWLTGFLFVKAYPFSTNHHEEVALDFTSNLLSGMNFIPKERQIQVVKVFNVFVLAN